jgi:sigma-54-specific transcriptional regulator
LVHHFLRIYGSRLGYTEADFAPEAIRLLLGYPWPGNIRELENTVHHALLVCPGDIVRPEDLRLPSSHPRGSFTGTVATTQPRHCTQRFNSCSTRICPISIGSLTKRFFRAAYEYCEQNQLRTARLLGISRNIVRDRLIRYGLLHSHKVSA